MADPVLIFLAIVGVTVGLYAVTWMFIGRDVNFLVLLVTLFVATSLGAGLSIQFLKYARVLTTVAIIAIGIVGYRMPRMGPAVRNVIPFLSAFLLSPLWSEYPFSGLFYKSFLGFTFTAGVVTAYSMASRDDLIRSLRFMAIISAAGVAVCFRSVESFDAMQARRFDAFGMNPGWIAHTSATLVILSSYLVFYDKSILWRLTAGGTVLGLVLVIMLSGTRAAALEVAMGGFVLAVPLLASRRHFLPTVLLFMLVASICVVAAVKYEIGSRIVSIDDTRSSEFVPRWEVFMEAPIVGHGWSPNVVGDQPYMNNSHSAFFQVAEDLGCMGLFLFAISITGVMYWGVKNYREIGRQDGHRDIAILPVALMTGLLAMSPFTSGMLLGTLTEAMVFGMAVGWIDCVPRIGQKANQPFQYRRARRESFGSI